MISMLATCPWFFLKLPWKIIYCIAISAPQRSWLWMLIFPPPSFSASWHFYTHPPPPLPFSHPQSVAFCFLLVPGDPESPAKDKHPIYVTAKIYIWCLRHKPGERQDLFHLIRGLQFITAEHLGTLARAAGIYPLGRLLLGGWKQEAKAAVTVVSLINGR